MFFGVLISLCSLLGLIILGKAFRSQKPDWNLVPALVVFLAKDWGGMDE